MLYLVRAGPSKFRFVCLFLLINCVPNTDKETMGQGARMTKCEQRINKCEASDQKIQRLKARQLPLFDPTNNIVKNFLSWLTGMGGGCRSDRQAQQLVSKRLKFSNFVAKTKTSSHLTLWTITQRKVLSSTARVNGKRLSEILNFVSKREGQSTHCWFMQHEDSDHFRSFHRTIKVSWFWSQIAEWCYRIK